MSVYLGYPTITKQYLGSLGGGGTITVSDSSGGLRVRDLWKVIS